MAADSICLTGKPETSSSTTRRTAIWAVQLEFHFEYDGGGLNKGGTLSILNDGDLIAQGRVERTISIPAGLGETMDTGRDTGVPVTPEKAGQTAFEGEIHEVRVQSGKLSLMPF